MGWTGSGQHVLVVPVHDYDQVEESPGHGQISDVGRPHLFRPWDLTIPQQEAITSSTSAANPVQFG